MKVIVFIIYIIIISQSYSATISEKAREIFNDRFDRCNLRYIKTFTYDNCRMLTTVKLNYSNKYFQNALSNPIIKIMILPDMLPAYFPEDQRTFSHWSNWNKPTRTPDNRFIFAAGNCCTRGGKINLYEYNPETETVKKVLDVPSVIGWKDSSHTDAKLHGKMGLMPDGTLWAGTQYGNYPPKFDNEKPGSHLFSYNVNTGEAKDWGVPLIENTLAETTLDPSRGIIFATGENPSVLCRDVINHKTLFADTPPNNWRWFQRASLLDEQGRFWSTDSSDSLYRFLSFDPKTLKFERHELSVPENPYNHKRSNIRAYTERRAMDGAFWCISGNGAMFKFRPEKPAVELVGVNWDQGRYTSTIAMDSTGRYLYYMPGGMKMQNANEYGPLVQYDTKTNQKKVLAWLVDYYYEKYGYWVGGTYGMEISADDSFLVIIMNGAFRIRDDLHDYPYETPSIFVVHIPESER